MVSLMGYVVLSGKMQVERHEMTLSIWSFLLALQLRLLDEDLHYVRDKLSAHSG